MICPCRCHLAVNDPGRPSLYDPVAAATACQQCLGAHCVALLDQPDPDVPIAVWHADAWPDNGEGSEAP